MDQMDELDPQLRHNLASLQIEAARDPEKAAQGRELFLKQAAEIGKNVTTAPHARHTGWKQTIQQVFGTRRKEQSLMFGPVATIILILSLAVGGGGLTVAAAQASQPDDGLYGLKLWSEEVRQDLSGDPAQQFDLALEFANRRAEEIRAMIQAGNMPEDSVLLRYQNQMEEALRLAVGMNEDQARQALELVQLQLRNQEQAMLQLEPQASQPAQAVLQRTRQMIQERLQWVDQGLTDPVQLRYRLNQRQNSPTQPEETAGQGGNPWTDGTPTPGSGYGPGPGTGECETCTPQSDGEGGQNPWVEGTPTPGSGYGPGPQATQPEVEPTSGNTAPQPTGAGPQPTQSGQGDPQPTGSPNGPGGGGGGGGKP